MTSFVRYLHYTQKVSGRMTAKWRLNECLCGSKMTTFCERIWFLSIRAVKYWHRKNLYWILKQGRWWTALLMEPHRNPKWYSSLSDLWFYFLFHVFPPCSVQWCCFVWELLLEPKPHVWSGPDFFSSCGRVILHFCFLIMTSQVCHRCLWGSNAKFPTENT